MATQNSFGITYPPIDDLLQVVINDDERQSEVAKVNDEVVGSRFALASYAASRGRQIMNYFSNDEEVTIGGVDGVSPLVDYYQNEKAASIAMRELAQGKLNLVNEKPAESDLSVSSSFSELDSIIGTSDEISSDETDSNPNSAKGALDNILNAV